METLLWAVAGVAGAVASAATFRRLRARRAAGTWRAPDGRIARTVVPRLGINPATWDTIARHRDNVRWWLRSAAAVAVGLFCVLLTAGAIHAAVTGA